MSPHMAPTPQEAASAITASRVEASLSLGRTPIGSAYSSPDICWSISGIPMASFNFAILRRGSDPHRQIDTVRQTFAGRSMPFVWWVRQEDSQDGLEMDLRRHGLDYDGEESIGMAIALPAQPVLTRGRAPITVESVLEPRDVRTWFAVLLGSVGGTVDEQTMALATTVFSHL